MINRTVGCASRRLGKTRSSAGTLIANPVLGWGAPLPADGGRDAGERLRTGAPLNEVRDRGLMYTGRETGYTDYPALSDVGRAGVSRAGVELP